MKTKSILYSVTLALLCHAGYVYSVEIKHDSPCSVQVPQEEVQQKDDANKPKSFLECCYENRYPILMGACASVVAIALTAYLQCSSSGRKMPPTDYLINPDLSKKSGELATVLFPESKENAASECPEGYGERASTLVGILKDKVHPIYGKICSKNYEYSHRCDMAVEYLERLYNGDEYVAYGIASTATDALKIVDPIKRMETKELLEQRVKNLIPVPLIEQSIDNAAPIKPVAETINASPDKLNSSWCEYFRSLIAAYE